MNFPFTGKFIGLGDPMFLNNTMHSKMINLISSLNISTNLNY